MSLGNPAIQLRTVSDKTHPFTLDSYTLKSENLSLTFRNYPPKISPPIVGGVKGRGGQILLFTPTLTLPHQKTVSQ
jgi:hypothetical protein